MRAAKLEDIIKANEKNLQKFIMQGVSVLEMKSGYGLDLENEIKLLDAINHLKDKYKPFITIVPTFMAAHAFPPEFKGGKEDQYVDLIVNTMLE